MRSAWVSFRTRFPFHTRNDPVHLPSREHLVNLAPANTAARANGALSRLSGVLEDASMDLHSDR